MYNEYARDALLQWMSDRPGSVDEIFARQAILKALLRHEHLFRPFAYSLTEFHETHSYLKEVGARDRTSFVFPRGRRSREVGQMTNLFVFFSKVYEAWFRSLNVSEFPPEFQSTILQIRSFLDELDVHDNHERIRTRGISSTDMGRFCRQLQHKARTGEIDVFWNNFFFFEACLSLAKGIQKHRFTFPRFQDDGLSISGFYHPLINNPVVNDITVNEAVTLITGPNMSGKSILLKSIGLCVTLAHLGLGVPAESCKLPYFDVIFISINLNDDILSGYSHFMTEVINVKSVVLQARENRRCFAIFDELFRGTNPEDALAISRRTIRGLTQFKHSHFFISTHLHQLKESTLANKQVRTHFIECQLIRNKPVFTYSLRDGWSDLRIGQILFEQQGLNELLAESAQPAVSQPDKRVGGSEDNRLANRVL